MNAEIILIGEQMQQQQAANSYANLISEYITDFGIDHITLVLAGVSKLSLQKALQTALDRSEIIITIGGFDIEGEVFANSVIFESLDLPVRLDEKEFSRIKHMYSTFDMILPAGYEKQAMFPQQCEIFTNQIGMVSGCALNSGRQCIITLPDSPEELKKMLESYFCDFLARFTNYQIIKTTVNVSGLTDEELKASLSDLLGSKNPTVKLVQKNGDMAVELTAHAATKPLALNAVETVADEIHKRLGDSVYGIDDDTLLKAVAKQLKSKKLKLALGEAGTNGFLTKAFGKLPAVSGVLEYAVTADLDRTKTQLLNVPQNILLRCGEVSQQTAAAMASGARSRSNADIGIAVTANIQKGNEFGSYKATAFAAVCSQEYAWVRQIDLTEFGEKENIIGLVCSQLLDMLRLYLISLPELLPGYMPISQATKIILYTSNKQKNGGEHETTPQPIKAKRGGNMLRKVFFWIFISIFIISASYLGVYAFNSYKNRQLADDLNGKLSESSSMPADYPQDYLKKFASLYAENPDIKGWISIDGTPLSYPVVQAADNDFYLRKDFYKNKNEYGIPFLDYEVKLKPQSVNTLIYGHNMKDGQMFGELVKYKNIGYYKEHPVINFDSVYEENKYKIISIFITNANPKDGEIFPYTSFINSEKLEELALFVENAKIRSFINIEDELMEGDKLLTLSTCTYEFSDARFVVVARKLRKGESSDIDVTKATVNKSPLLPDVWYKTYGKVKPDTPIAVPTLATISMPIISSSSASLIIPSSSASSSTSSSSSSVSVSSSSSKSSSSSAVPSSKPSSSASVLPSSSKSSGSTAASSSNAISSVSSSSSSSSKLSSSSKQASTSSSSAASSVQQPSSSDSSSQPPSSSDSSSQPPSSSSLPAGGDTITVNAGDGAKEYDTYDMLCQIVANEMGSTANKEALKAQAVASYTYIKYENEGGRVPSVGIKTPSSAVKSAVKEVLGQKIYYNGSIISSTYFSISCGKTGNSDEYWYGNGKPYLISVDSSVDANATGYKSTKSYSVSAMKDMLESKYGITLSDTPENWLRVAEKFDSGYVKAVSIDGQKTATGRDIREGLCSFALRSTCFEINFDGSSFVFTTYGYGHGIGMSQWGAMLYAQQGWSYTDILTHYYSGTTVQ